MPVVLGTGAAVGVFAAHTGLAGSLIALPVLHNLSGLSTHGEIPLPKLGPMHAWGWGIPACSIPSVCVTYLPAFAVVTGTVLAATTIAAGSTAAAYAAQGVTNLPACLALASTGVFTAAAGSVFSQRVKAPALKRVTGVVLICIAPVIFMGSRSRDTKSAQLAGVDKSPADSSTTGAGNNSWYQHAYDTAWRQLPFAVAGSIAGFSQGFIGVGGGLVMTTLMTVGTDLSQHTVIATALSATTLINTSATVMHYRMGHVCYTRTLYTTLTVLHGNTHA